MGNGQNGNSGPERAVVFLDLLGFANAVKDDTLAAAGLLQDYSDALATAVQDEKLYPPESYATEELRQIAQRSSTDSFRYFLPMSDSVFIVADDPSSLVFQVSHFLVESFWPNLGAFEHPEGDDPRAVTVRHFTLGADGVTAQPQDEQWFPVLFRGGVSWGEAHIYEAVALADGKPIRRHNLMGKAVVEAVGLEKAGTKGPVLLCSGEFAVHLTAQAKNYLGRVTVSGTDCDEICWPVALFETATSLHDALQNEFGQVLRGVLNLLKYFAGGTLEAHYLGLVRLAVRSALLRFPAERQTLRQHLVDVAENVELVTSLFVDSP